MAFRTAGSGGIGEQTANQQLDPGILLSVSIYIDSGQVGPLDTFASLDIASDPQEPGQRQIHLVDGYVSQGTGLAWHGYVEIQGASFLLLRVQGDTDPIVRVHERRLTKSANGPTRKFITEVFTDLLK